MQDQKPFVRKIGDIDRNLERYAVLSNFGLSTPNILYKEDTFYDMEYIPNLDIKTYLLTHQVSDIFNFIKDTIQILNKKSYDKDYTSVYHKKLTSIDFTNLIFTKDNLIDKLPKILPSSDYHGDFTLENILYNTITKKLLVCIAKFQKCFIIIRVRLFTEFGCIRHNVC